MTDYCDEIITRPKINGFCMFSCECRQLTSEPGCSKKGLVPGGGYSLYSDDGDDRRIF